MNGEFPTRAVAACFALACFGVAVIAGLVADRSASSILISALVSLVVGHVVGSIAAGVIAHAVRQSVASHIASHPVPDSFAALRNLRAHPGEGISSEGSTGT